MNTAQSETDAGESSLTGHEAATYRTLQIVFALAAAFSTVGGAFAQAPVSQSPTEPAKLLYELATEVRELRIEVAVLRLAWREQRLRVLEEQIRAAERERRVSEYEEGAGRDEVLTAETLLAGSELDSAERAELTGLKDQLLTERQQQLNLRRSEAAERESALLKESERERSAVETCRREITALQGRAGALSRSNPTP